MRALEQENAALRKEVGHVAESQQAVEKDAASRGFTLASRPEQTTPPDFDTHKYVAEGNFPGSITLPGTNISIQIGGFVQLDAITDSNLIGSTDSFIVSSIPTAGETAGQTNFSVRQTRLFVKTEAPTERGQFVTYVEGDFFASDDTTEFRIRHAFGEIGNMHKVLAGQTWSTFMDASVYPAIFDYQGPNAMVLVRTPMVRYTSISGDQKQWQWQVSAEDPNPDVSEAPPQTGSSTAVWPNLASNIRWSPKWGHLQLAGILRELTFDPTVGSRSSDVGWGVNFTGQVNLFEPVAPQKQDNVVFQVVGGEGIENYINDTSGLGLDGFVDSNGDLSALPVWGAFAAYQHFWSAKWGSSIGYSHLYVDDDSQQGGGAYQSGDYLVLNVMWYPTERILCGVEGLWGIRTNQDGSSGDDGRVSFSAQYRF
jgi:hypothetical protein